MATTHNRPQNWLVGVDKSVYSEGAFYMALRLMNKETDTLFLMHVSPQIESFMTKLTRGQEIDKLKENQRNEAMQILARFQSQALDYGVQNVILLDVTANHVGESVCEIVKTKHIDTIVVGRRSMNKIKRMFIGSTSDYCIRHSSCNVLIAQDVEEGTTTPTTPTTSADETTRETTTATTPTTGKKVKRNKMGAMFRDERTMNTQELGQYQFEQMVFDF